MRTFIAIRFDEAIKEKITEVQDKLRDAAEKGHFTDRDNLHLTLIFLGEVSPNDIMDINEAMKNAAADFEGSGFTLKVSGPGRFKKKGGDICWLGFENSSPLMEIYTLLSDELYEMGFDIEDRPYTPHLTLGRQIRADWQDFTYGINDIKFPVQTVKSISLMESSRVNGKLVYSELIKVML
jgi:2''-5'' RNA ligase